jgi:hypothetical protein
MRCAIYARVSTLDQEPENQLRELRRYVATRGWTAVEYVDRGVSGSKDRRRALDQLLADAKRHRLDVVVVWRLDRLGRSLKHLITLLEELQSLGVAFVSLHEGIDATTPAGKLQMHILGAIAEFERGSHRRAGQGGAPARAGAGDAARQATEGEASDCRSWRVGAGGRASVGCVEVDGGALDHGRSVARHGDCIGLWSESRSSDTPTTERLASRPPRYLESRSAPAMTAATAVIIHDSCWRRQCTVYST